MGDFSMLGDFVILDLAKDARTQIILDRPFLATTGCKLMSKRVG